MISRLITSFAVAVCACASLVRADTVTMTSGSKWECVVVSETAANVIVRRGYGVLTIPKSMVEKIERTPPVAASNKPADAVSATTQPAGHIPTWSRIVDAITKTPWGADLRQIPATYISNGAMKDVPYSSYSCSDDYEANVYGDPDDPACVEIGVYRSLLANDDAKAACVELLASLMPDATDATIARAMNRSQDLVTRDDVTIEITPPTAPDAYGGWWISVYSTKKLDASRATQSELASITVAAPVSPPPSQRLREAPKPAPAAVLDYGDHATDWTSSDMASRRVASGYAGGGDTGRVYVRGYYRSNGTYVHAYSRRK